MNDQRSTRGTTPGQSWNTILLRRRSSAEARGSQGRGTSVVAGVDGCAEVHDKFRHSQVICLLFDVLFFPGQNDTSNPPFAPLREALFAAFVGDLLNHPTKMAVRSLRLAAACIQGLPLATPAARRPATTRAFTASGSLPPPALRPGRRPAPGVTNASPARGCSRVRYMSYVGGEASNGLWNRGEKWLQRAAVKSSKRIFLYNLRGALLRTNEVPRRAIPPHGSIWRRLCPLAHS